MVVANTALILWPFVAMILFAALGREKGLIWTVMAGYLLLPEHEGIAVPGLPDYTKVSAISLSVMLGVLFFRAKRSWPAPLEAPAQAGGTDRFGLLLFSMIGVICFGGFMTLQDNSYPLVDGERVRQGMAFGDLVSLLTEILLQTVPFYVAWRWLRAPEHHVAVLKVLVITGLLYSIAAVYEMRFSPQINRMVYDFFPHDWRQHIRGGDFRPVVFLSHGLWLAFFLLVVSLAAFGLFRAETDGTKRLFYLGSGVWIALVLLVSPNLGAAMLVVVFAPLVLLLPRLIQARVAMGVAIVFMAYPAVRQAELLPLEGFLGFVSSISQERADSLAFRLDNEDQLLARAAEKPAFGWGGWGRWLVIDEKGRKSTVSDGLWVIALGERGWVGYIGQFGILTLPLLAIVRARRRKEMSPATATMAMLVAVNLVYLIPNASLGPIEWLVAGSVAGFISWRPVPTEEDPEAAAADLPKERPRSRYTRFGNDRPAGAGAAVALRRDPSTFTRTR